MTILQNRWYNSLVANLHLDPHLFQIFQPSAPMMHSNLALWAHQDIVPPASLTLNTSVYQSDLFSDEYAAVISQLQFPESKFREDIGEENYQKWVAHLNSISPPPPVNQLPILFRQWALTHAPSVMTVGVSDLSRIVLIISALQSLQPYQGPNAKPIDFMGEYAQLVQFLGSSSGMSFSFESNATSDNVEQTWTGGNNSGLDGLWSGYSSTSRLSRTFALSQVTVSIQFQSFAVWTSTPGAWYNSSLLHTAYSNQATPPWPVNANPTWDEVFGQSGSMQYLVASLVVADGVNATVISDVNYGKTDQETIQRNVSKGLWPFYAPTSSSTTTNVVTFDNVKGMTMQIVTQPGNPFVIGNNVLAIAQYLGHAG
jgi:hypothetical protein